VKLVKSLFLKKREDLLNSFQRNILRPIFGQAREGGERKRELDVDNKI
jgi:hypothetical protein